LTFYIQNILDFYTPFHKQPPKVYYDILKTCEAIQNPSLEFLIIQMSFFKFLSTHKFFPQKDYEKLWIRASYQLYKKAPFRTDALAPFFLWSIKRQPGLASNFLEEILSLNPNDPVALWFYGVLLKKKKNTQLAGDYFLKAYEKGIANFMPTPPIDRVDLPHTLKD
jgi:hypothetical protein